MQELDFALPGVRLLEQEVHGDQRGWFFELWHARRFAEAGLPGQWMQCNVSHSYRGTLRGLHLQRPSSQAELVTAVSGTIFDVAVDVRRAIASCRWPGRGTGPA